MLVVAVTIEFQRCRPFELDRTDRTFRGYFLLAMDVQHHASHRVRFDRVLVGEDHVCVEEYTQEITHRGY